MNLMFLRLHESFDLLYSLGTRVHHKQIDLKELHLPNPQLLSFTGVTSEEGGIEINV
jgi:hypothetical protein